MAEATNKEFAENNVLRWIYQPRPIYFSHNCAKDAMFFLFFSIRCSGSSGSSSKDLRETFFTAAKSSEMIAMSRRKPMGMEESVIFGRGLR